jgi:hypothetical protein
MEQLETETGKLINLALFKTEALIVSLYVRALYSSAC